MEVDELLEKPYWIVDILPEQVAKNSAGQYFAIEQYYLSEPKNSELRTKYANLVLKLNCYYDIVLLDDFAQDYECGELNPDPDKLVGCFVGESAKNSVSIIIKNENTMVVSNKDDTYLVFAERMISIHKKPINMGNLLSPKSISGKIDAGFFDSGRQLSCI